MCRHKRLNIQEKEAVSQTVMDRLKRQRGA